ncbi:serine/threonine protein kinase [Spirosoma sordidisoli]|uniref:Serine/threonine protein kinase n=1 Tax=Spirosoma sordidisoli TaxID=2502893 RepID=A0A4Q2UQC4_9BACT|nr:serine/threonine-protein kinase [Spirosoma sordidisoli]RYC69855.1 serine/threonine protein kinase [Spirosoma sordidisoli]
MSTIRFDTRFPGYEVLSELGRSNARILKARHLATGELVAIKHFALNTDAETIRRFQRESAIMTSIAHPNIVKVREVQVEAELPYIVMELIEGGSLKNLFAGQQRIDVPTTIRLGLQMASAFKAIHPQGIIHRDIKPENILYRPLPSGELHFLLTDFGVARLHEQSTTLTGQSLMTYEYASPEQFNDPKGVGIATDYYSLGVVLYECLHGSVPFALDDHSGIVTFMNKVLTEAPPVLTVDAVSQPLSHFNDLLRGLLQKKAADRISDPDELTWLLKQAELNYLQANRASNARPVPIPPTVTVAGPAYTHSPAPATPGAGVSATTHTATRPSQPPAEPPATNAAAATPAPQPRRPRQSVSGGLSWGILALTVLLAGAGVYYFFLLPKQNGNRPETSTEAPVSTGLDGITTDSAALDEETLRQQQEEAERQLALRKQQAKAAVGELSAEVTDFKVGFFGGIKNVKIQLRNPSSVDFASVAVRVNYYKDNGGLYKSENVFFSPVGPNMTLTRTAPNSDRGVRVTCKVINHQFAPDLDSLMTIMESPDDDESDESDSLD